MMNVDDFRKERPSIWIVKGKGTYLLKAASSVPLFNYRKLHRLPIEEANGNRTIELILRYLQPFHKKDAHYWITRAVYYESIGKHSQAIRVFERSLAHFPQPIEAITSAFRFFLLRLASRDGDDEAKSSLDEDEKEPIVLSSPKLLEVEKALEEADKLVEQSLTSGISTQPSETEAIQPEYKFNSLDLLVNAQSSKEEVCNSPVYRRVRQELQQGNSPVACTKKQSAPTIEEAEEQPSSLTPIQLLNSPSKHSLNNNKTSSPIKNIELLNSPKRDCSPLRMLLMRQNASTKTTPLKAAASPLSSTPRSWAKSNPNCASPSSSKNGHCCSVKRQLNFDEANAQPPNHTIKYALIPTPKKLRGLSQDSQILSPVKRSNRLVSKQKNVYESIENLPQGVCYVPNPSLSGGKPLKASTILSRTLKDDSGDAERGEGGECDKKAALDHLENTESQESNEASQLE